ncbi:phage head-tail connector protein [Streptomyces endophytica]|uniref:Phage Gp19/Gp15/Gp42 family protein n=1 Tax=Streptomyces endophytica TaxID=2991496 RepID=A0ABY6P7H8_9ACTN|nr:hypothetical protein [Streptomyces endophytica]UZJ29365.1 phage Gp19/Gp15/Gp42 family protein [Streptomyces endophytica]
MPLFMSGVQLNLTTLEEIERRLDAPVMESDRDRVRALIEDASAVVSAYAGFPDGWPIGRNVPKSIQIICRQVVLRCFNNPMGITSESMGDYSYRRSSNAVAGLQLTLDEKKQIDFAMNRSPVKSVHVGSGITWKDRAYWGGFTYAD